MGEVARALVAVLKRGTVVPIEHDPEWPSPCEIGEPDGDGMIQWRPVPMEPPADFTNVEAEAGRRLHPDVKEFYGSFWGGEAGGQHSGEPVLLRVAWNAEDLADIKESIVEHLEVCAAESMPPTVLIAHTDSDLFFSLDNATGEVLLEEPGHPRLRVVAASLAKFLTEM